MVWIWYTKMRKVNVKAIIELVTILDSTGHYERLRAFKKALSKSGINSTHIRMSKVYSSQIQKLAQIYEVFNRRINRLGPIDDATGKD